MITSVRRTFFRAILCSRAKGVERNCATGLNRELLLHGAFSSTALVMESFGAFLVSTGHNTG